jgi:shikimate kinase
LYNMFNALVKDKLRVLFLVGSDGSGKTMITKHLSNYL